jgi:hypothetical protein
MAPRWPVHNAAKPAHVGVMLRRRPGDLLVGLDDMQRPAAD